MIHKIKNLGPGLLFAGAAIGVSHLVQSTRAGADFGLGLLWALLLVNLFVVVPRFNGALKLIVYVVDAPKVGSNLFCKYNFVSEPVIAFKSTPSTLSCNFERTKVAPNLFKFVFLYKSIAFLIEDLSASAV